MKGNLSSFRALTIPLACLIVFLLLAFFGGRTVLSRIQILRRSLSLMEKSERVLERKLSLLEESSGEVLSLSDSAVIALPARNSALLAISQLKNRADEQGVLLDDLKVGIEIEDKVKKISRADIKFDIEGPLVSLLNFLVEIKKDAPLSSLRRVALSQSATGARFSISLSTFWSEFPTKLPAVNEPITGLSDKEREILELMAKLNRPSLVEVSPVKIFPPANPFLPRSVSLPEASE